MNNVTLIGRLTADPKLSNSEGKSAVCRFSVALDRGKDKDGNDMGADFPNVVCFGKTAENCHKYLAKGRQVGVQGKIRTGKYEKEGKTYYTTEVFADRVEFLGSTSKQEKDDDIPEGFEKLDDDSLPF